MDVLGDTRSPLNKTATISIVHASFRKFTPVLNVLYGKFKFIPISKPLKNRRVSRKNLLRSN